MPGPLTLGQIASRLGGRVAGDAATLITQVGSLEHAGDGQIAFFADPKLKAKLAATRAAAVIVLVAANVLAPSLSAQWPAFPTSNVPKTADGKPNLLAPAPRTRDGKPDLSGIWENPGWRNLGNGVSGTASTPCWIARC